MYRHRRAQLGPSVGYYLRNELCIQFLRQAGRQGLAQAFTHAREAAKVRLTNDVRRLDALWELAESAVQVPSALYRVGAIGMRTSHNRPIGKHRIDGITLCYGRHANAKERSITGCENGLLDRRLIVFGIGWRMPVTPRNSLTGSPRN